MLFLTAGLCTFRAGHISPSWTANPLAPPTGDGPRVLIMILTSYSTRSKLPDTAIFACEKPSVRCVAYSDEVFPMRTPHLPLLAPRMPSNWITPSKEQCCLENAKFCGADSQEARRLPFQQRLWYHLNHVLQSNVAHFRSGAIQWFVQIDDDSLLNADRLLRVLTSLDHTHPVYMGDFLMGTPNEWKHPRLRRPEGVSTSDWWGSKASWWEAAVLQMNDGPGRAGPARFTCSGAGIVLSSAAVQRMDVAECASQLSSRGCFNVDWKAGACANAFGVQNILNVSCNLCGRRRDIEEVIKRLESGACSFAHVTPDSFVVRESHMLPNLCQALWRKAAISHGTEQACTHVLPNDKEGPKRSFWRFQVEANMTSRPKRV